MEQVNKKLLLLVIESTGSNLYPRIHSKLRNIVSRCVSSYHDKSSWEDSDDDVRGGFRGRNSNFNRRYNDEEDDFEERPRFSSNRSRNFNNFDRDRPRFQNSYNDRGRDRFPSGRDRFPSGRDKFQSAGEQLRRPQWESIQLKPFEKNFYTPSETVLNRSAEEIAEFRKNNNLSLLGDDIPNPILEFSEYEFPKEVNRIFSQKGFERPTPIQSQGWPIALSGKDFVGIGQTGSGKTLGFAVPGLVHIKHQPAVEEGEGPVGLVLGPTRELVQQINEVSNPMFASSGLRTACLFGGASKNVQARSLYQRPSLCIATPGRLLDFLESGVTDLKRCTYLVLDEADRMLDMGFEPQIRKIISQIRPDRQTLMWSATWPKEVEELATDFLDDFVRLNVGSLDLFANPDIKQEFEICERFDKKDRFIAKMVELTQVHKKVLIFSQTKVMVDNIARMLHQNGIKSRGIHGDHSQNARDNTLDGFRSGRFTALVATDVASRGLDVDDITLVVNFDFPNQIEDYVHRIGRTGRAGKAGKALSFLTSEDSSLVRNLTKLLQKANQEVPRELSSLLDSTNSSRSFKKFGARGYGKARGKGW